MVTAMMRKEEERQRRGENKTTLPRRKGWDRDDSTSSPDRGDSGRNQGYIQALALRTGRTCESAPGTGTISHRIESRLTAASYEMISATTSPLLLQPPFTANRPAMTKLEDVPPEQSLSRPGVT